MKRFLAALLAVFAIHALTPGGLSTVAQAQIVAGQPAAAMLRKTDVYPGASVALDFASVAKRGQFFKANGVIAPTFAGLPGLTATRASGGYAEDQTGALVWFNSGQARITNKGLLVEEARTNSSLWSQAFDNAVWAKTNTTVTADQAIAPDGTLTADKIAGDGSANFHSVAQAASTNATHVAAAYLKANDARYAFLQIRDPGGTNGVTAIVDLQTGTITSSTNDGTGTGVSATITPSAYGFYRVALSGVFAASGQATDRIGITNSATAVNSFATSTSIYAWQADENAGAVYITSPIPTTSATATRPADDVYLTGSYPSISTIFVDALLPPADSVNNKQLVTLGVGADTTNRRSLLRDASAGLASYSYSANSGPAYTQQTAASSVARLANAYDGTNYHFAVNGVVGASQAGSAPVGALSKIALGARNDAAVQFNSYIRAVLVYPSSLSDPQLQALTSGVDPSSLRLDFAAGSYKNTAGYVRTNLFLNSAAPATQTITVSTGTYTLNVTGSGSATVAAGTATITGGGAASAGSWRTFTVTGAGTVTVTVTGSLNTAQLEATNYPTSFIATGASAVSTSTYASTNPADVGNLTFARASTAYGTDSQGNLILFASNVPRITNTGLLIEESRTNSFLNSFAPVTQTITVSTGNYTTTVWGSGSVTVAAGTATLTGGGSASAGSPRTINVTGAGTITATVIGSPTAVQVEAGAFGTSIIPTTSASATRAADVFGYTGLAAASIGTYAVRYLPTNFANFRRIISGPTGGNSVSPLLMDAVASGKLEAYDSVQLAITTTPTTLNALNTAAMRYDGTNVSISSNGGTLATSAGGADFQTQTALYFGGNNSASTTDTLNGLIVQAARYGYAANDNELLMRAAGSF